MSTIRVGLKSVSCNSPAITNHRNLKSVGVSPIKTGISPLVKFSPLKKASVVRPASITEENKENETQTDRKEYQSSSTQTDVVVFEAEPEVPKEDLFHNDKKRKSAAYWRSVALAEELNMDEQLERSFEIAVELYQSNEEVRKMEKKMKRLTDVLTDIITTEDETEVTEGGADEVDEQDSTVPSQEDSE